MLVAVEINDAGPFRFILDTGANRSAISQNLADALGLKAGSKKLLQVHGVTGSAELASFEAGALRVGEFLVRQLEMPVLPPAVLSGADGILSVTELGKSRIDVDFKNDAATVVVAN